jgi:succinate-acetate transporter protein
MLCLAKTFLTQHCNTNKQTQINLKVFIKLRALVCIVGIHRGLGSRGLQCALGHKGVSRVLQGCYKYVTSMLQHKNTLSPCGEYKVGWPC